tara:strand:- start:5 stop:181 length:177 start_codon:yes stop_codon:yes gene_type:complete
MLRYRIVSKKIVAEGMGHEEASNCLMMIRSLYPEITYDIEEYNWSVDGNRLGRDPDLH